ncbi:sugar ABC transporter substrate-binding protein [Actinoallomurus sp. CA-150999]|uniref:sugar ABC transporter substrate-binding protein n=1 Tax=Actinoallomurus sp. CA-150999 TaxID=3239887 RepID=UPI003D933496
MRTPTRFRAGSRILGTALAVALALSACSSTGGKKAEDKAMPVAAGKATTPRMKITMVTHAPSGDTFWDIIQKGARAAAAKDNVQFQYSNDVDPGKQATLVQNAIDSKVDGIAVTLPNPPALIPVIKKAVAAGIPVVAFNAGVDDWQKSGALMYFGQDETLAGQAAGKRLGTDGAKKVLCVLQEQGQVQLEARCNGVQKGFSGTTEKLYVTGTNMPSVRSTIAAKLKQDKSIDHVVTLGAPIALAAVQSVKDSGSPAKVVTFDTNPQLVQALQSKSVQWAIDQQPYLQGYESIDSLWLYKTNGNVIGGGQTTLTGPSFIDQSNLAQVAKYASAGTR